MASSPERISPEEHRITLEIARLAGLLAQKPRAWPRHDAAVAFLGSLQERAARGATPEGLRDGAEHPLDRLVRAYHLSPAEIDVLLLAGIAEEHEGIAEALRALHPTGEPRAFVGLAARLFCDSDEERSLLRRTLESGGATGSGLLRVEPGPPFYERSLSLTDGLWPALRGVAPWPRGWARADGPAVTAGLEEWLSSPAVAIAREALALRRPVTVLVTADRERDALERARALVHVAGRAAQCFEAGASRELFRDRARIATLGALATALDVVPVLQWPRSDDARHDEAPSLDEWPGTSILCARTGELTLRGTRATLVVSVAPLSTAEHASMWRSLTPEFAECADALAARYPVDPAVAAAVTTDARERATLRGGPLRETDLADCARVRVAAELTAGVRRVTPTATWENLVLPTHARVLLESAVRRLRNQRKVLDEWGVLKGYPGARGVRVLLAGPPGTGKTLAAEALAHALGVDLLVVDVSRIMSKWIGETEKNLAEAFDLVERTRAVLLFDEADALFGRRTTISSAQDRYANLETAYLLSRIERFDGIAVLTTNLREQIDRAFFRRVEFVVDFELPDAAARATIWRHHLPPSVPLDHDVDFEELARSYAVSGATIRSAAAAAAFLAADDGGSVTRGHIRLALAREEQKFFGLPVSLAGPLAADR